MPHESYSTRSSRRPRRAIATMKPRRRAPERRFVIVREIIRRFEGNRAIAVDESDALPTGFLAL